MITGQNALEMAIELFNAPSRVHAIKSSPLPDNMEQLLRIAAGEEQTIKEATTATKRSPDFLREAAEFFIEQIMLFPEADNYRILGVDAKTSKQQVRAHMALLIKWLHPDHAGKGMRTVFISRVTGAWDTLKTAERRATYDKKLQLQLQRRQSKRKRRSQTVKKTRNKKKATISGHKMSKEPRGPGRAFRQHVAANPPRHQSSKNPIAISRQHPAIAQKQRLGFFRRIILQLFNKTIR